MHATHSKPQPPSLRINQAMCGDHCMRRTTNHQQPLKESLTACGEERLNAKADPTTTKRFARNRQHAAKKPCTTKTAGMTGRRCCYFAPSLLRASSIPPPRAEPGVFLTLNCNRNAYHQQRHISPEKTPDWLRKTTAEKGGATTIVPPPSHGQNVSLTHLPQGPHTYSTVSAT